VNIANARIALSDGGMARTARTSVGGICYHVLSRGNRREAVFHKPGDYDALVEVIMDSRARLPADALGFCPMPNRFHLVIRPQADAYLGRWCNGCSWPTPDAITAARVPAGTFGNEPWTRETAPPLAVESTVRSSGKPRKDG
jgi:hypothetical protein